MNSIEIDPRLWVVDKRFSLIKRIIAVTGFKGGVGKSSISVNLALAFVEQGFKTGLLDLDFTGASCHILLGSNIYPREDKGIIPPYVYGIKFMTAAYFMKDKAVALRGNSISNAIRELIAVTIWDKLDFLIIDMPPGLNDTALDSISLIKKSEILPICIPSKLSQDILNKSLEIYKRLKISIIGVVENMAIVRKKNFYFQVFYDKDFERTIGLPKKMIKTNLYKDVFNLASKMVYDKGKANAVIRGG